MRGSRSASVKLLLLEEENVFFYLSLFFLADAVKEKKEKKKHVGLNAYGSQRTRLAQMTPTRARPLFYTELINYADSLA